MNDTRKSTRLSADERRDDIIEAAIAAFAAGGLTGTSTQAISESVGISQPYLFKLFGTKNKLFLAAYDRVCDRLDAVLETAAAAHPDDPQQAMALAYRQWLKHPNNALLLVQAYAACGDVEIRAHVRAGEAELFAEVVAFMDGDAEAARDWLARGFLETIGAVLDFPDYMA